MSNSQPPRLSGPPSPSIRRHPDSETRRELLETQIEYDRVLAQHIANHVGPHDRHDVLEIAGYDTQQLKEWHKTIYGESEDEAE